MIPTETFTPQHASGDKRLAARWLAIGTVVLAGIIAALHVGKAPIALPQMHAEFGRSQESLSWVMSVFPFLGVVGGIAAGMLVRRWGDRRLLCAGLLIIAGASAAGAFSKIFGVLLATRIVEGMGFLLVVVAAPAVLQRLALPSERNRAFGAWSTFMGGGMALSMLLGPLLGDWRRLWLADAGLALLAAILLLLTTPAARQSAQGEGRMRDALQGVRRTLQARGPLLLALAFAAYSLQFFAVLSFLPTFLMQRMGVSVGVAGVISAAVVAMNIVGNLLAGPLLTRGVKPSALLAVASIAMGLAGAGVFLPVTPAPVAVLLCFAFSAIAGLLPATIITCAPQAAPEPSLTPLSMGLVMQGNYLGQVLGPIVVSTAVAAAGWPAAALPVMVAAFLGVLFGVLLKLDNKGMDHAN